MEDMDVVLAIIQIIIALPVSVLMFIAIWKIFTKAGRPGWGIFIPIYNAYLILKIAGKPGWWLILYLIPIVNFVIGIIVAIALAESFGKGGGFAAGMIFLPFIFYPILGLGSAKYLGAY